MADQHQESKPEGEAPSAPQAPGSQVPMPNLVGTGVFSPTTEKQVSDLLAEMQQYASTATPGTTTTMQFSYQKSKHTSETSGQEPKVVESSHFEKAIHQTPPAEQPQPVAPPPAEAASAAPSIFSQIPQFLQEKLGFGGGAPAAPVQVQTGANQQTQVSYHHTKKTTTTTTTSSGGEQQTTTTTSETHDDAPTTVTQEQSHAPPAAAPEQENPGLFAPLKSVAEKLQEQVSHIPQMLQEKFGAQPETTTEGGQQQTEINYQHTKKTTTTTSSSSTSGDHHETTHQQPTAPIEPEPEKSSIVEPLKEAAGKVVSGLEHMVEQAANLLPHSHQEPTPTATHGNVQMEFSKHSSRQVMTQSGEAPPHIETTSSGYTQLVHGIFNGVPVIGGIVPSVVPVSVSKSDSEHTDIQHQFDQSQTHAEPSPAAPDASSQLEEQLKKLGIQAGHPMTDLLQQTLAQHQRAKTPESNMEIQYSAQRTHSSRTVTYETAGSDPKAAHEALQQLQSGLGAVAPPSQGVPEPAEGGEPKSDSKETMQTTETDAGQPPATQG